MFDEGSGCEVLHISISISFMKGMRKFVNNVSQYTPCYFPFSLTTCFVLYGPSSRRTFATDPLYYKIVLQRSNCISHLRLARRGRNM
jgi:hypothetical protein